MTNSCSFVSIRGWTFSTLLLLFLPILVMATTDPSKPDAIVAADGSGDFRTVQEAIDAAPVPHDPARPWTIFIRAGTYEEVVRLPKEKRFLHLRGEDAASTTITAGLDAKAIGDDGQPIGTFRTATFHIEGDDINLSNLTVENSFGPGSQALALRLDGDRIQLRRCRLLGYQDTLLVNRGRHYIADSLIAGSVDFIFGAATSYFDNCELRIVANGYITAASTPEAQPHGMVFRACRITSDSPEFKTYLGRPWRDFASVVFLDTEMSAAVREVGWHNWNRPERESTSRYAEYGSRGPGANEARAHWARRLTSEESGRLTPETVLAGQDAWTPHP
jgi:pectinesterase